MTITHQVEGQTVQMQSSDPSQTVINLRLILTDRHFDAKTGLLRLNCSLAVGRPSSAVYFNRSLELSAALMHPTTVLDPRPTQRSSKSSKDSRSASYSSGLISSGHFFYFLNNSIPICWAGHDIAH
jgi:hypothetical protein